MNSRKISTFHCDKWLSKSDDDKQILRELTCATSARPESMATKKDKTSEFHHFNCNLFINYHYHIDQYYRGRG